ncbi:DUF3891 family protein [Effusibacillus consociatus]|uniref:DUF3891 family protein n=1 Tax=Effusibacillus consociatus TaxID=1117041 RepID=A0ABV9PVJ1_9BACL
MIVHERDHDFIMIRQHDHAQVSGEAAKHWKTEFFPGFERHEDVILGIYQHDRAWIELDDTPLWNDRNHVPYSFVDFPSSLKLTFYRKGIDEVEVINPYAGLLCSLHYASFFENDTHPAGQEFLRSERKRQQGLVQRLHLHGATMDELQFHFRLLQFCDNLSLYLCLNEPGVSKSDEFPWYRNGFSGSDQFSFTKNRVIMAHWIDKERVSLSPSPFEKEVQVSLMTKAVDKERIKVVGIAQAYQDAAWTERKVSFVGIINFNT